MLEDLWHPSKDLDRLHYQGIIQAAIAVEHFRKENWTGALGLYQKACEKWSQLPPEYMGMNIRAFKEKLDVFFDQVQKAGQVGMRAVDISQVPKIPIPE
jgi:predicted metal-dependent hydrolase